MYKNVLRAIEGIELYPIISLVVFVTFFVGLGVYVARLPRGQVNELKNMPFEGVTND